MRRKGLNSAYCRTEKQILNALTKILREKSIINIKVKDIVKDACIATSSFYLHYNSVNSIIMKNEERILRGVRYVVAVEQKRTSSLDDKMREILCLLYRYREYLDVIGYSSNIRTPIEIIKCMEPILIRSWPTYSESITEKLKNMLYAECYAELNLWWKEQFSFDNLYVHAHHLALISITTPKVYASMYANA